MEDDASFINHQPSTINHEPAGRASDRRGGFVLLSPSCLSRTRAGVLALLLLAACASSVLAQSAKLTKLANQTVQTTPAELVSVIVQTKGAPSTTLLGKLPGLGGSVKRVHKIIPAFCASLPAAAVPALASDPSVLHVSLNRKMKACWDYDV